MGKKKEEAGDLPAWKCGKESHERDLIHEGSMVERRSQRRLCVRDKKRALGLL